MQRAAIITLLLCLAACADAPPDSARDGGRALDGGGRDATTPDAGAERDAGGPVDGGPVDGGTPIGSAGCGMASALTPRTWAPHTVDVAGVAREYFVWLPDGYDATRPYPVVYQFHGCSDRMDRESNNPPVQSASGADAIHVRSRAVDRCYDTAAMGPDVALFDAMVREVEGAFCADPARRFATGYSGGAFMTHRLACVRGDVLRGVATIAGGMAGRSCRGQVAALLIHDADDGTVNISASESARDALLAANHCDVDAPRTPTAHAPCEAYAGCDEGYPVVFCRTTGMNHSRQDGLAAPAFWDFLSALP